MPYKDKDRKTWTAQWFEENVMGERVRKRKRGFKTKKEAVEYEVQQRLNSGKSMDMTLSDFIDVYFEDKQNELKERTMKNKRYMMEQHIVPYFGKKKMNEITAAQIIQWQNEMQKRDFSDAYLRMIQNQLTSLFTHASKIYDLQKNPCKKVKKMGNFDSRSLCCFSHYLQLHVAHYLPPFSKLSQRFQHIIQSQLCILNTVIKKRSTLFNPNEFADCKNIRVFCNV